MPDGLSYLSENSTCAMSTHDGADHNPSEMEDGVPAGVSPLEETPCQKKAREVQERGWRRIIRNFTPS
ncbi:hypothetical protein E5D57_011694 [Metarhizium anisopliae]|nr:hypothetical protein E5D57_011694 [Metarhizium anisopliae]